MAKELRLSVLNNPTHVEQTPIEMTISIGITEYQVKDTQDTLIARADRALYLAKNWGRNTTVSE